eukprot:gene26607-20153_t
MIQLYIAVPLAAIATAMAPSACPDAATEMATFNYTYQGNVVVLTACEDLSSGNGSITFVADAESGSSRSNAPWPLKLPKAVYSNVPTNGDDNNDVLANGTDILGNLLLGIHGFPKRDAEPTLSEVMAAVPPLRSIQS